MPIKDITGQQFGRLVAVKHVGKNRHNKAIWLFKCDCGAETKVVGSAVRRGDTQSCGCLHIDKITKHGKSGSEVYSRWSSMIERCENPNHASYPKYGGKGITVCTRWQTFENFLQDMGEPNGLTLDRIDSAKGYCPGNCRWATYTEQNHNLRNNRFIEYEGDRKCVSEWAKEYRLNAGTLWVRLFKLGWTIERALTTPTRSSA